MMASDGQGDQADHDGQDDQDVQRVDEFDKSYDGLTKVTMLVTIWKRNTMIVNRKPTIRLIGQDGTK